MEKAVATTASAEATQLWLGPSTTCFSAGHIVYARGNNNKSQLGCAFGGEVRLWREIFVAEAKVVQIGCGWEHTIILCESGAWFGAGSNDYHQLIPPCHRLSEVTRLHSFTQLWLMDRSEQDGGKMSCGEGDKIVALSTCVRHTLFLTANGRCWGIGEGRHGQLSERWEQLRKDSRTTSCATAVELHHPAGLPWKVVSAGHFHSLLLDDSGTLYACGRNKDGEVDASSAGQPMRSLVAIASSEVQDAATMWFSSLWLRLKGAYYIRFYSFFVGLLFVPLSPLKRRFCLPSQRIARFEGQQIEVFRDADGPVWVNSPFAETLPKIEVSYNGALAQSMV
mmetsp:Transcript_20195/g.51573  ORF Transcript_20195/g.51573 Transcript_20195/m.51573 type:complete len:337 (-) Transcript_20195:601-1611(-)